MNSVSGKFCPVCKHRNEPDARVCVYCGAPLEYSQEGPSTTRRVNNKDEEETNVLPGLTEETIQKAFKPPKEGIAIYVRDYAAPIEIRKEHEFTLGRLLTGKLEQDFVNLKPYGGYENGVSRRHALIRHTAEGYEILDLGSTNGTWLNKKRLIPDKPYPLESGAQLRLGRLQIFVIYQELAAKP